MYFLFDFLSFFFPLTSLVTASGLYQVGKTNIFFKIAVLGLKVSFKDVFNTQKCFFNIK